MVKKIALIEDESSINAIYKRQLDLAELPTDGFLTGNEGLIAIKKGGYDLVLLDIMLPDINGLEILKELKQDNATKNIPVVMLTNLGQDSIIKEGFTLGAVGYLVKASFSPSQIVAEVKNILKQQETPKTA